MWNLQTFTLGEYRTHCYVVYGENAGCCCVIDPGYSPEVILHYLAENGLTLEAIFLTHGHFDHVGGANALVEATHCKLWMNRQDYDYPLLYRPLFPLCRCEAPAISFYGEGDILTAAGLEFSVMQTPGHTQGSVCLVTGDAIFSGDTLFAGTCGRTDLPGSDSDAMAESLKRLAGLEGDYRVFPGHGESTTLAQEKRYNPYMR